MSNKAAAISSRKNSRSHILQRMANTWPQTSRAREEPNSNLQQFLHGIELPIFELAVEVERTMHNHFPQTVDPGILDVIYHIGLPFTYNSITAKTKDGATITPRKTNPTLYDFWYTPLPTDLEHIGSEEVMLHPVRASTAFRNASRSPGYMIGQHYKQSFIDQTGTSAWSMLIGSAPDYYLSDSLVGGWGNGYEMHFYAAFTETAYSAKAVSTSTATGQSLLWSAQVRALATSQTSMTLTLGYDGLGSAVKTIPLPQSTQWNRYSISYQPPSSTSVGAPYIQVDYSQASGFMDGILAISDQSLIAIEDTSLRGTPHLQRGWVQRKPTRPYITVDGATNMMDVNEHPDRPGIPTVVRLSGFDPMGRRHSQRMVLPHNGTHQGISQFLEVDRVEVDAIYPDEAQLSLQWQNYNSPEGLSNPLGLLATPYIEGALFYGLRQDMAAGRSYFAHQSFLSDDLLVISAGYDGLLNYNEIEFKDTNGANVLLSDLTLDLNRQIIWALSTSDTSIKGYNPLGYWPNQSAIQKLSMRSVSPALRIAHWDMEGYTPTQSSTLRWEGEWISRSEKLIENKWILHKPSGAVGLIPGSTNEVPLANHTWMSNIETVDQVTKEYRYTPQYVDYTATEFGDYVLELQGRFYDEDKSFYYTQTDMRIFSVASRNAMTSLPIPVATNTGKMLGLELDRDGNFRIAFEDNSPMKGYVAREELYRPKFHYYFEDTAGSRIYFREPYASVKLLK